VSFTIYLPEEDGVWLSNYVAYLNAMGGNKVTRKWSRKSKAETWVVAYLRAQQKRLQPMIDELGPLPDADPPESLTGEMRKKAKQKHNDAVEAYAKRAQAWLVRSAKSR